MTIFVFFILCAVLCDNCECRGGREMGIILKDKYLFIGMCRL